jgi:hypothetical protein
MSFNRISLLLLVLNSFVAFAGEESWQGSLQDGSRVTIDPATNKAMRNLEGELTPLWNGVHRLNNGAVIIVRDGVVVRDESVIEAQQEQERNRLNVACMQLVSKVCGAHNECQSNAACDPAKQLLLMERDELNSSWSGATLESSTLCLEALANEGFFTPCARHDSSGGATACERLAESVCGSGGGCDDTEGCDAARQLISMEQQDLFEFPGTPSETTTRCQELLNKPSDLFKRCGT